VGSNIFGYHASMLADTVRVERYREAIQAVVRPDDVVVDIGTGTGILAYFACQAGARHVYAIDDGPVAALAGELCRANGYEDRITFLNDWSSRVELPERADVLVTETLWNFGLGERMLGTVLDARERLLKPGGRIIPEWVQMVVAPVEMPAAWQWIAPWDGEVGGIDLRPLRDYATNNVYKVVVPAEALLTEPAVAAEFRLDTVDRTDVTGSVELEALRAGTVHGIAGWFVAGLGGGVQLTNAPPNQTPSWWHAFLPLSLPRDLKDDERVRIDLATGADGTVWSWRLGDGPRQSTAFGMPLAPRLAQLLGDKGRS
jgi:protein arginine N-methyltransferase 1